MSLNKEQFVADLKTALKSAGADNKSVDNVDAAMEKLADKIADKVDAYIRTMTITIPIKAVQVEGTATAQTNLSPIVISDGVS